MKYNVEVRVPRHVHSISVFDIIIRTLVIGFILSEKQSITFDREHHSVWIDLFVLENMYLFLRFINSQLVIYQFLKNLTFKRNLNLNLMTML